DGKSKLIAPNGEAAWLHLRVPQHGWNIGKRRAPADGAWQIIDGYIVIPCKCIQAGAGGTALEIDSRQAGAAREGAACDSGDAAGDRDVGQAGEGGEGVASDAGDPVAYREAG